jgi:hypothetical protein
METRDREPRASALGWYEIGPWPDSEGAFSSAQIGKRGGRYIRIYIVLVITPHYLQATLRPPPGVLLANR